MGDILKKQINIPIYDLELDLFYGDIKDILPEVYKMFGRNLDIDEYTNAYAFSAERKSSDGYIHKKLGIILKKDTNIFTIHHEAIHVSMFALEFVNLDISKSNHEALTYLVTFIAKSVDDSIKKWEKNRTIKQSKDI